MQLAEVKLDEAGALGSKLKQSFGNYALAGKLEFGLATTTENLLPETSSFPSALRSNKDQYSERSCE